MILVEGEEAPEAQCVYCLVTIPMDEYLTNDHVCDDCFPILSAIASGTGPRIKD